MGMEQSPMGRNLFAHIACHFCRRPEAGATVEAIQEFLQAFFPVRSQFELPPGYRNRFLHVDELRAWEQQQRKVRIKGAKSWR